MCSRRLQRLQTPRAQKRRHRQLEAQRRSRVVRRCCAQSTPGARPRRAAAEEQRHVRTAQQFAAELPSEAELQRDSSEFAGGHCKSSHVRYCSKRRHRGYQTQIGNLLYKSTQINFLPFDYPAFIQYANQ